MNNILLTMTALLLTTLVGSQAHAVDNDNDGVDDSIDRCPNTFQLKKVSPKFKYSIAVNPERLKTTAQSYPVDSNGCEPDSDGDGVINSQDYCPNDTTQALSMGVAANGCPKQSDNDGTPDYRDNCPGTKRDIKTDRYGCEVKA